MKPMKIFLVMFLSIVSTSLKAIADDGNTIFYYARSTMNPAKFSLDDVDKITFTDNYIQIWEQDGMNEIPFDDFLLFTFSEIEHPYVSAVEQVAEMETIRIFCNAESKTVRIESGFPIDGVIIYDMQGRIVARKTSSAISHQIALPSTPAGVYLIRIRCGGKDLVNKIVL